MKRLRADSPWPKTTNAAGYTQWMKNHTTGQGVIIVCVFPSAECDALEVFMTLVHEAVHVWQFLCDQIGEKDPGIEMEAYGIENITRGLIEAYSTTQGKGREWLLAPTPQ